MSKGLIWFRNDLRAIDNTALAAATNNSTELKAVVSINVKQWEEHYYGDNKTGFIIRSILDLETHLNSMNINLEVIETDSFSDQAKKVAQYCNDNNITDLYANKEYEFNEQSRDIEAKQLLDKQKVNNFWYDDQVIINLDRIRTGSGDIYSVFTPFKKNFLNILEEQDVAPWSNGIVKQKIEIKKIVLNSKLKKYLNSDVQDLWPAGHDAALLKLTNFIENHIDDYKLNRDYPNLDQTSKLSPYLAVGAISCRECFKAAYELNKNEGVNIWISELIWREFYKYIMFHRPRVSKDKNYNSSYDSIKWNTPDSNLDAWQEGRTGVPLLDAAMRQLVQTGWMHNRLRMVAAMFLTKNLFYDWRVGEKFFAKHLIDVDYASNNGGWQWSASTGTDAAPYFRIFNPVSQSERFDPEGDFIKKYCPELKGLSNKQIHNPSEYLSDSQLKDLGYPKIIVDLKQSRQYAIDKFKEAKNSS